MKSGSPTGRRSTARNSRVRFANERKKPKQQRRSHRLPKRISVSRDDLLGFYILIFLGPLFIVVAGGLAIFAHDVAVPSLFEFVVESLVYGVAEMWQRPTLILALALVLSIFWCLNGPTTSSNGTHDFRRGRDLGGLDHAQRLSKRYSDRRRSSLERKH